MLRAFRVPLTLVRRDATRPSFRRANWKVCVTSPASRTSKEIAALLYLSRKTVESHRSNVFTRPKVRSAAELVCYAIRTGHIKP